MPMNVKTVSGSDAYGNPFLSSDALIHGKVDVSTLLIDGDHGAQVDSKGYLKPGVPFKLSGTSLVPLDGTGGEYVYACVAEATNLNLATVPPTNTSLGAVTTDPFIGCVAEGVINRDILEDNLGRALHADEVAAFAAAGSQFKLTVT